MIIQCPYCNTRFRLAATRLVGPNPMLKCSRCRHIFPPPQRQRAARSPASPAATPERELDLSFEDQTWGEAAPRIEGHEPEDVFELGAIGEIDDGSQAAEVDEDPLDVDLDDGVTDERVAAATPSPSHEVEEPDDAGDEEEWDEPELSAERAAPARSGGREDDAPVSRHHSSVLPVFLFFALVVGVYFFFARTLMADPARAEAFVAKLPLVGGSLASDRLLFRKVALGDVTGSFVRLKEGKEVYVISGTALNTASHALRQIQIEGQLLDGDGHPLRVQTITCGGMLSRRLLRDLTVRELDILGKVEPSKRFSLAPGESTPFAIVFPDVPAKVAEFTSRVTAAQRQA